MKMFELEVDGYNFSVLYSIYIVMGRVLKDLS